MRPGRSRDALDGEQDAGHEAGAVVGVVADRERLPGGAEQHLLVRDQPAQADASGRGCRPGLAAAGALDDLVLGRVGAQSARRCRHALRGRHRRARRRVDLAVVVQLDDLGRLEPRRGELGEAHHEHGADGEVGRDEAVALGEGGLRTARESSSASPVVPTTACTPFSPPTRGSPARPRRA